MNIPEKNLRIHGDNIVECERALELICDALSSATGGVAFPSGPFASLICPKYTIDTPILRVNVEFFPGFRRWNQDILSSVQLRGGALREAADALITEVVNNKEIPLFAFEFCAALPAGNQAWQRNGRGYSFASAGIPYFFLADLGGYELGENRTRKNVRMPNPAAPFSYISFAMYSKKTIAPVYRMNLGASEEVSDRFKEYDGYNDFHKYILSILLEDPDATKEALANIYKKALDVVAGIAKSKAKIEISGDEWKSIYKEIEDGCTLSDYLLKRVHIPWNKKASIAGLTSTFRRVVAAAAQFCTGLTAPDLPACLIAAKDRAAFTDAISAAHEGLSQEFLSWLKSDKKHLAISWVMGFKPGGDDARPDRGLPPMVRMLVGPGTEILTIVYGPLANGQWAQIRERPVELLQDNGLWESIMACSDGLLIDAKDRNNGHADTVVAFPCSHWQQERAIISEPSLYISSWPRFLGENDVDTVLHLIFARIGSDVFFEGSCNPPGGDWSSISVLSAKEERTFRYLTLPRVSSSDGKRPDHVFQFIHDRSSLVIVESKERLSKIETQIGPRLIVYLTDLFKVPASIERLLTCDTWSHGSNKIDSEFNYTTVSAGIYNGVESAFAVLDRGNTDIVIGIEFQPQKILLHVASSTKAGSRIIDAIEQIVGRTPLVDIDVLRRI